MPLSQDHYLGLRDGRFDGTTKEDLDRLFAAYAARPEGEPLVVHFHGGLVNEQAGLAIAARLQEEYQAAGGYPVFFVWRAGLLEVLTHNLGEIFRERIYQRLLERVTQFTVGKLRQRPGERGQRLELPDEFQVRDELRAPKQEEEPFADLDPAALPEGETLRDAEREQLEEALEMDYLLTEEADRIAAGLRRPEEVEQEYTATRGARAHGSTHTLMSPEVLDEIRAAAPRPEERGLVTTTRLVKGAVTAAGRTIARFARRRDHGVHATIVEELLREFYLANAGRMVWDLMKRDTADAFGGDAERHGGTAFLEGLKRLHEGGRRPRVLLVGHSTGAVYICHLLRHADALLPAGARFEVAFLAPACDFRLFAETLALHGHRIEAFRMFTMRDALEKRDRLVPVAYPRSLLYLISGILEDEADKPVLGMERFFSGRPPFGAPAYPEIDTVRARFAEWEHVAAWSVQAEPPGTRTEAAKHGDFDTDRATIDSLRELIGTGF